MKSIFLMLIFLGTFMGFYFLLSCIGMLWDTYEGIITNENWFLAYSLFLGWWIALLPTVEFNESWEEIFEH